LELRADRRKKAFRKKNGEVPEHKLKKRSIQIVGGQTASAGQFKFTVFLKFSYPEGVETKCKVCSCTGFLLTPNVIGTAAHCFDEYIANGITDATGITLTAGVVDHTDTTQGQRLTGTTYQVHPEYEKAPTAGVTNINDYAFIRTDTPFELNDNVAVVPFASELPADGAPVYLAGWGNTVGKPPETPNELQFAEFAYLAFETCKESRPNIYENSQICIKGESAEKSPCNGDSGGALFVTSDISNPSDAQVIGLTSFGSAGCTALNPTVFANALSDKGSWLRSLVTDQENIPSAEVEVNTF